LDKNLFTIAISCITSPREIPLFFFFFSFIMIIY
jgi:hypothetical protein